MTTDIVEFWKREAADRDDERKIIEAKLNRALLHCRDYQADVERLREVVSTLSDQLALLAKEPRTNWAVRMGQKALAETSAYARKV